MRPVVRLSLLLAVTLLVVACQDRPSPLEPGGISALLSDGAHGGNPDFFFLPPLAGDPSSSPYFEPGGFNGRLRPVMAVFKGSDQCSLSNTKKKVYGPLVVLVSLTEEMYQIDWNTDKLQAGKQYRLCIFGSATGKWLGFVDLIPFSGGLKNVQTGEIVKFQKGRVVPVKFRIERGALSYDSTNPDAIGTEFTVDKTGGSVTLVNETGDTLLAAVSVPSNAVAQGDVVTIVVATEAPRFAGKCLPDAPNQSNWCYQIRTEPALYQFGTLVRVEICVDPEPVAPALRDQLRVHKYNTMQGLQALPWADPTLIGNDCTGSGLGLNGATPQGVAGGVLERVARWAGRLLAPSEAHAAGSVARTPPKGIGGLSGSFSDFGGAVPSLLPADITVPLVFTAVDFEQPDSGTTHIVRLDAGAGWWTAIYTGNGGSASYFPDGSKLAFGCFDASSSFNEICVVDINGSVVEQLTTGAYDFNPAVGPGDTIAFSRSTGGNTDIWSVSYVGRVSRKVADCPSANASCNDPAWSPDGSRIAFTWYGDVYLMNSDGSNLQRLTYAGGPGGDFNYASAPAWSPSGDAIALSCTGVGVTDLCLMDPDGSNVRHVLHSAYWLADPVWSPNGNWIAFSDGGGIFLVHPDGSGLRQVVVGEGFYYASPTWPLSYFAPALMPDEISNAPTDSSFGCGAPVGSGENLSQSFTPSAKRLKAVDLTLRAGGLFPAGGYTTSIQVLAENPTGTVLATISATVPGGFEVGRVRFELPGALALVPGDTYVIQWVSPPEGEGVLSWMGSTSDSYVGGNAFDCTGVARGNDLNFSTWW